MIRASTIVFLLPAVLCPAETSAAATATAYVNGSWFDGSGFVSRHAYVIGETLSFQRPRRIDAIIDLEGGYVVPPFGEAHNHNVEPLNDLPKVIATYLEHGIFYVKNPNNLPRDRETVAPLVNLPDSIDITFANGGWTSTGGHPMEIAKRLLDRKLWTEPDGEGGFYWTADTRDQVERSWAAYLEQKPQFVKTYLLFSGDSHRQTEPESTSAGKASAPRRSARSWSARTRRD